MSRRIARELVLQSLFQIDFTKTEPEKALAAAMDAQGVEAGDASVTYAEQVLQGTMQNLAAIDAKISGHAKNWELSRMPMVDRNILRMAVYEMLFAPEKQPVNIAVNEAVELAKLYGSEKSGSFINGLLGQLMRDEH
jgi:N utilization substance protein B